MKTVLVAEESDDLRRLLVETLPCLFPDWRTLGAADLAQADQIQRTQILSLAIIDMDLGAGPAAGLELLGRWRRDGAGFPVVATTSSHSSLRALWAAEPAEVLLKPWEVMEIEARLARAMSSGTKPSLPVPASARADGVRIAGAFAFAGATITADLLCLLPDGQTKKLGAKEYGILHSLAKARGTVVLRESLLREIWGSDADLDSNSVNVYFSRLRRFFAVHGGTFDAEVSTESKVGWRVARQ